MDATQSMSECLVMAAAALRPEFGAGEGIQTLDPNLGKMIRTLSFTFAHLRSRAITSYNCLTFWSPSSNLVFRRCLQVCFLVLPQRFPDIVHSVRGSRFERSGGQTHKAYN
jgi:hypothetical protein